MKFPNHGFLSHPSLASGAVALVAMIYLTSVGRVRGGMVPADLSVASSGYGANYTNVAIGDAGAAVSSVINLTGAPAGSIVTGVDVGFDVGHEYPGDLRVTLVATNKSGQQPGLVLWTPGDRSANGYLSAAALTDFNGAAANQSWQLVVQDLRPGQVGYLDQWSLRVRYLAPPQLRGPGTAGATGFLIGTTTPAMQWNPAPGATRYRLRAQRSPYDAASTVFETLVNGAAGSFTLPPGRLTQNRSYRWTATSLTSSGTESGFGAPLFFATPATGSLLPPAQIGPGNSGDNNRAFLPNDPPVLQWQGVVGAVGYKVRVSEYPYDAGNEVLTQTVGLATSFTPVVGSLIPGVRYRWTVTALYPGGESTPWEEAQYFEISDPNAPQISSAVSASATRGSAFSYTITATNSPTSYGAVDLPEGLSVNAVTGVISGTPTFTGAHNVLVKALNAVGGSNRLIIMDVRPPVPVVTSTGSTSAVLGRPFSYRIVTTENPTSYGATNLTAGLTLDPDSGLITGAVTTAGNYTIILSATNSGGTGTESLTLEVASGPPYDTKLAPSGVHENQPVGTVVGNFNTLDGDPGLVFTYALVAGAGDDDNASFQIFNGEAALRTGTVFDYETRNTYSIRVRTTDSSGQFLDKQITVRVLNVIGEVQGGLQLSDATVYENLPAGTMVGILSAVDPDPGETFTFAVAGGADEAKFAILGNLLITAAPLDREEQRHYSIRIRVRDSGGNFLDETAIIEALDDTEEDSDGDGLTQAQEVTVGTSDLIGDSDSDGSGDGPEVAAGTNPRDSGEFAEGTVFGWGEEFTGIHRPPASLTDVMAISASEYQAIALKSDGTLVRWGRDLYTYDVPPGLNGVVEVAAGKGETIALRADGTVVSFELSHSNGHLLTIGNAASRYLAVAIGADSIPFGWGDKVLLLRNDGTVHYSYSGSGPPAWLRGVVAIAGVENDALALREDGTLVGWKENDFANRAPDGLRDVVAISGGSGQFIALKSDGTIATWIPDDAGPLNYREGLNEVSEIASTGAGEFPFVLTTDRKVVDSPPNPVSPTLVPAGLTGAVAVAGAPYRSFALRSMGEPARLTRAPLPRATVGVPFSHQIPATGPNLNFFAMNLPAGLSLDPATGILSGTATAIGYHYIRLRVRNPAGEDLRIVPLICGTGTAPTGLELSNATLLENQPEGEFVGQLTATDADPGDTFTFTLISGRDIDRFQIVGDELQTAVPLDFDERRFYEVTVRVRDSGGNVLNRTFTIEVQDDTAEDFDGDGLTQAEEEVLGTSDFEKDWDGDGAGDGPEVAAGTDPFDADEFPDGTVVAWGNLTLRAANVPGTVTNVVAISTSDHSLALTATGQVLAWGENYFQQTEVPPGLSDVTEVSAGGQHSLALRADGTVAVWGRVGEDWVPMPSDLTDVIGISAGDAHSLAVRADGTVSAWGANYAGQCDVPQGLSGVVVVAAGGSHSIALLAGGYVVAWGYGADGQTAVPAGLTGVVSIGAGDGYSVALRSDGTVVAWGYNYNGQAAVPAGLADVVAIAAGYEHSLARTENGAVVGWGANYEGQTDIPAHLANVAALAGGYEHSFAVRSLNPPPVLQNIAPLFAGVGLPFSHQITVSDGPATFIALGLPPGLSIHPASGLISGTPTEIGVRTVRIFVRSSRGQDSRVAFIAVGDGEPPTALNLSNVTVMENQSAGTVVGVLTAIDSDPGQTFTFSIIGGDDGLRFTVEGNQLLTVSPMDFESQSTYSIRVRVTDSGAQNFERNFFITALDDMTEDFDGDGLTQAQETLLGTSDLNWDSDGDFSGDGAEVDSGTNPLDSTTFANGTIVVWGDPRPSIMAIPRSLRGVIAVTAASQAFALRADGTVAQWGAWQGTANLAEAPIPTDLSGISEIAANWNSLITLKNDGAVTIYGASPFRPPVLPAGLVGVQGVTSMLALKSDGTVVGEGTAAPPSGLREVVAISSNGFCLALRADGTVVSWGHGAPVVPAGLSNVISIVAGGYHGLIVNPDGTPVLISQGIALKSDGTLVAFGNGGPSIPAGLSGVVKIAAGERFYLALKSDGSVVEWGMAALSPVPTAATRVVEVAAGSALRMAIRSTNGAPILGFTPLPNATLNTPYSHQIPATGTGLQFSARNLPPGLSVQPDTGVISGTPTDVGHYFVRIVAQNSAGRDVRIFVLDSVHGSAPTAIGLTSNVVPEDVPIGTVIAQLTTAGALGAVAYSFVTGAGATDNGKFVISGNLLATAAMLDFETDSALDIRVRVTDSTGQVFEETLGITVLDRLEIPSAPVFTLSNSTIPQDLPSGAVIGRLVRESGAGNLVYTLTTGADAADNHRFRIDGDRLLARYGQPPPQQPLNARVRGTDTQGNFVVINFPITVTPVPYAERFYEWKARLGVTDVNNDDDHDGLTAYQEWAFGGNLEAADEWSIKAGRVAMTDGNEYLTISFIRAFGGYDYEFEGEFGYDYEGVTYRVEWSTDLANWASVDGQNFASEAAPGAPAGHRRVTMRSPVPLSTEPRQFMRVLVLPTPLMPQ